MAGSPFKTINAPDQNLNLIQSNISSAFISLIGSSPFLGGQLIESVKVLSASATSIPTGLGRVPKIWVLCDQNTGVTVWRTSWDKNSITLQSSGDCTVTIWVN